MAELEEPNEVSDNEYLKKITEFLGLATITLLQMRDYLAVIAAEVSKDNAVKVHNIHADSDLFLNLPEFIDRRGL